MHLTAPELLMTQQLLMEGDGRLHPVDPHLGKGALHAGHRFVAVMPPGNDFRQQGIIVGGIRYPP